MPSSHNKHASYTRRAGLTPGFHVVLLVRGMETSCKTLCRIISQWRPHAKTLRCISIQTSHKDSLYFFTTKTSCKEYTSYFSRWRRHTKTTLYFNARILYCIFHDEDDEDVMQRLHVVFQCKDSTLHFSRWRCQAKMKSMHRIFQCEWKRHARTLRRILQRMHHADSTSYFTHSRLPRSPTYFRVAGTSIRRFQVQSVWIGKCVSVAALLHLATTALLL